MNGLTHVLHVMPNQLDILIEAMKHNCETSEEIRVLQYLQHVKRNAEIRAEVHAKQSELPDDCPF
jgi:TPP-dependent indolepyruvate ferredoxin oxidoreductase alpha subunit